MSHIDEAGAEIVDSEMPAAALKSLEHLNCAFYILHHHAFGNLKLQQLRASRSPRVARR